MKRPLQAARALDSLLFLERLLDGARKVTRVGCLVAGLGAVFSVFAEEPRPPATATDSAPAEFKLTGVAELHGTRTVLLLLHEPDQLPRSFILKEGQASGGVKPVKIDVPAGRVHVRYKERDVFLSFATHGVDQTYLEEMAERQFAVDHSQAHKRRLQIEREQAAAEEAASVSTQP